MGLSMRRWRQRSFSFFRIKIGDDVVDDSFFIDFREAEIHQGRTHKSLQTAQIEFLDLFSLSLSRTMAKSNLLAFRLSIVEMTTP